jgi:pyruvate dehydrogenase E1 component
MTWMSALPHPLLVSDPDAVETQEWLDALEGVIEHAGEQRAHYLIERLSERRVAPASICPTRPPPPT